MRRFRRIAALILALAMCFTLLTSTVFADDTFAGYIYYNGNGNTGGSAPGRTLFYSQWVDGNLDIWAQVSGPGNLTKTGYTFTGWINTSTNHYPGTTYAVNQWVKVVDYWSGIHHYYADLDLSAQWTPNTYSVTFKTSAGGSINGGTSDVVVNNVTNGTGMSTITPTVTPNAGYTFAGWTPTLPGTVTSGGTYTATFTLNKYSVTFKTSTGGKINGGTSDVVVNNVNHGTTMSSITPSVTPDAGYHFVAWSPLLPATVTSGGSYTATFAINTYDVTFKTSTGGTINGGTSDVVVNNVATGTSMSSIKPTVAANIGYTFSGWTPELPATVTSGGTYTANFTLNSYTVTFKTSAGGKINGGTSDVVVNNVNHGTNMTTILPSVTPDTGYHFVEWTPTLPDTVTGTGSYTATFAINKYTVTFKTSTGGKINGGTSDVTVNNVSYGTNISDILPSVSADTGYTFYQWAPVLPATVTAGGTYTATFTLNDYTVTFSTSAGGKINGGTADVVVNNVDHGTLMSTILPSVTPDDGYHFVAWTPTLPNTVTGPGSYTATFAINQYTVTFKTSTGGKIAGGTSDVVVNNVNHGTLMSTITPTVTPDTGYHFVAWTPTLPNTVTGAESYTATFELNKYTVTFKTLSNGKINGGTADVVVNNVTHGTLMTSIEPTVTPDTGYHFVGWYPSPSETVTQSNTYTAVFAINTYDVTFKTSGNGKINGVTVDIVSTDVAYGTLMSTILPTVTPDTGYHFTGWTPTPPNTVTSGGTYTANFEINKYTVTFKTLTNGKINGGTADVVVNNVTHGTLMTSIEPTVTPDTGYHFVGWYPSPSETVTQSNTYTAIFVINTYDVTFKTSGNGKINGGTVDIVRSDVAYGTQISTILPTLTPDTGYHFTGWTPTLPETVTIGGSYTANFAINKYNVTFMTSTGGTINGGTNDILVSNVNHGTPMSSIVPTAAALHGYTFAGWDPALPESVTIGGSYTAKFNINQYTMTFDSTGGSAVAPITQNFNTTVAKPADPTRAHYTFAGWVNAEGGPVSFPHLLTDDITVYAKWTINNYTIMFDSQGGSNVSPVTQNYNTQVTKPADPTRYGFTFSGWYTGINGTGTLISFPYTLTGDITVYARWTAGTYTMSFNSEGGSAVASVSGNFGDYVTSAETPTKAGYTFDGWYSASGGTGSKINFPYNLTGNVTVYAKWVKIEVVSAPSLAGTVSSASSQTASISTNPTPTEVPGMGNGILGTTAITIGFFSLLTLAGLAVLGFKKRKAVK